MIASCPDCGTDLQDEAFSFWCPACEQSVSYTKAFSRDDPDD